MIWDREAKSLKSLVTDEEAYNAAIKDILDIEVLYIDDFLKVRKHSAPTDADVKLAFEIINTRYNDARMTTLLSSELMIDELLDIDEAVGSRILERAGEYSLNIGRDRTKNWRLRGAM